MKPSDSQASLMARLLELPVAEREAFLRRAAAENPGSSDSSTELTCLRPASVEVSPVTSAGNSGQSRSAASESAARVFAAALRVSTNETSGTSVGPYKLLQKLGEGGFGVVWMAEQSEPFKRRVALKIVKVGMDTEDVIARFEAERQALALMDHPSIARVFDAGATESGRPYFVMELVRGIAITRYCDENRLSPDARLRLFIAVCQAVQHAHQKGVIHRDLKPSNILVTLHDGVPVPKVIDFGIAKATGARLTDKTLFTQFHTFIGTPVYTSPEQMEMSGLDVDTRSDIYSLGVLLYELLTGRPPFDADALVRTGLEAMRRTIREVDPPRPSNQLGTLTDADRTTVAQQRGTDATKLSALLSGDLDWIVMRCLEKDRTRRYESASGLAADLERHLRDVPVVARPPSPAYQLQKFVRRHRVGVAAMSAIVVSLLVGFIASATLLVSERAARSRAVVAEQAEGRLRQQAEVAREAESKRATRTALSLADQLLHEGKSADGIAYLVHVARKELRHPTIASRLASVLTSRNFLPPEAEPIRLPSPALMIRHIDGGQTVGILCEDGTLAAVSAATDEVRLARLPSAPTSLPDCGQTGRLFSFLCRDNAIRVFNFGTMQIVHEFRFAKKVSERTGHNDEDPTFIVRLEDDSYHRCDTTTGRTQLIETGTGLRAVRSRNGRWLAIGFENSSNSPGIRLRDLQTGEVRHTLTLKDRKWISVTISPDGQRVATCETVPGSEQVALRLWSLPDGRPLTAAMTQHDGLAILPFSVSFSDDSRFLMFWGRTKLAIHSGRDGTLVATPPHYNPASGSRFFGRFTRDGTRMVTWTSATFAVWELATSRIIGESADQGAIIRDFSIAEDDSTATTVSTDGHVRIWNLQTQQLLAEPVLQQSRTPVASLSPDGRRLVLGTDSGDLRRFGIVRGAAQALKLPWPSQGYMHWPSYMHAPYLPDERARVLAFRYDAAFAFDLRSGQSVAGGLTFPTPVAKASRTATPSPDLKTIIAQTDGGKWHSWRRGADAVEQSIALGEVPAEARCEMFCRELVVFAWGSNLRVWNTVTGQPAGPVLRVSTGRFEGALSVSPDGRLLAAGANNGELKVWDIASGDEAVRLSPLREATVLTVQFSPDGSRIVVTNSAGEARLFETATGQPASPVLPHANSVHATFSRHGRYLETHSFRTLRLWDGHSGAPVSERILPDWIRAVSWDETDSRMAVTGGQMQFAQIWDVKTLEPLTEPMLHPGTRIVRAIFSPDGRFIKTDTVDGNFHFWSVPPLLPADLISPSWLLDLATLCAGKTIDADGKPAPITGTMAGIDDIRRAVAALPADAPLAEWGHWFLADRVTRSIAPGFTITPPGAEAFARRFAPDREVSAITKDKEAP